MLVERRQRRSSRKAPSNTAASPVSSPPPVVVHGSRFNPIFEESLDMDHAPVDTTGPQSHAPMHISQSNAVVTPAVDSSSIDAPSATVVVPSTSKSSISQAHGKEKSKVSAKQGDPSKHLALPLQKTIVVQRSAAFPISKPTALTNRRRSSLSSARFGPFPRPSSRFNKANHTVVVVDENANPNVHSPTPNPLSLLSTASGSIPAVPIVSCEKVSRPQDSEGSIPAGTLRDNYLMALGVMMSLFCARKWLSFFRDLFLDNGSISRTPYPFAGCFPTMPQHVLDSLAHMSTFSEPCNRGGLGVPRCNERNLAFMHKLAFQLTDGNWNTSRLSALLDPVVVPYVIGVPPPSLDDTRDMVAWRCTPTEAFTVASTYECLLSASWDAC
ncbi:hypothetical protein V6N12_012587 [Hibiscus sabdariffa]|uniref:Uncharacterized protein n=1 Tax=Hibiscus sabdariffa TaxID=183260 RepID=A0ABR2B5K6_9ROSI